MVFSLNIGSVSKTVGTIYMDNYTFIFTEDFNSSLAGYTYENGTIYMRSGFVKDEPEFIRVCNHEILHHFVNVEKRLEENFIMEIDDQVKLPTCDKLLKIARLVIK